VAKRCLLTLFETMVWKLEQLRKIMTSKWLNGALWRFLKRSFGS